MKFDSAKFKSVIAPAGIGFLTVSVCHSAYSLQLPTKPLLLESSIEPNVMLMLDDSGSMTDGWNYGDYVSSTDYGACPSAIALANIYSSNGNNYYYVVTAHTDSEGNAYFTHNGNDYAWGLTSGTDSKTGKPIRCFKKTSNYYSQYSDDFNKTEKGNFWNYYYSNSDGTAAGTASDNWGLEDQKYGVGERIEIVQDAAKILVRDLDGIRIGLAGFDGAEGGRILVNIESIDEVVDTATGKTQAELMIEQINTINANGSTPLGETLYEIGRYFLEGDEDQTLTLHPGAITGTEATATASSVFAGEPKYEGAASKPTEPVIQAYCQKNFVVMLTDGEPTSDTNVGSYLGEYAKGFNTTDTSGPFDDVALALYDMDLRPDLNEFDGTPVRNNITTYLIAGFGLTPTDVLNNTVDNGVGLGVDDEITSDDATLYKADSGSQLSQTFDNIFEEIFSKAGSLTAVSFNAGTLQADTALYQATFARAEHRWTGDLKTFKYDSASGQFADSISWSAAKKLDTRVLNNGHSDRLILTMSKDNEGVEFVEGNWSELSAKAQGDLKGGNDDAHGKSVMNYLRGESNNAFRDRATYLDKAAGTIERLWLLGDIVNSSPVEVGEPELAYPDYGSKADDGTTITAFGTSTKLYSTFYSDNKNRTSVVYAGSNDGMVHGFYGDPTSGGEEAFAYIPGLLYDDSDNEHGLYYLTDENYDHRFYVDGPITASDVFIDPAGSSNDSWRTIIVGSLRAGGRGIYALDVTDPSSFSASNADDMVLWEFGANTDADMGHVYGKPRVSMMNNGKWAVIVGNGYNSGSGEAKLFIIFLEEGADGTWDTGDWIELGTGVSGDNGMSAPVLADLNGDRIADRIYAGDLKGNLWAFDVSSSSTSSWGSVYNSGTTPEPLFIAEDADGNPQPITTQPSVTLNPEAAKAGNGKNILVYFGTGKLVELTDYSNNDEQTFYVVWDRGDHNLDRSDLTPRTLSATTITTEAGTTIATRTVAGDEIGWFNGTSGSYGWKMDMPEDGERIIVDPFIQRGTVFFTTALPTTTACSNGGAGWVMSLAWDGLASNPPIADMDGDGDIDEDDMNYVGTVVDGGLPSGAAYITDLTAGEECAPGYLRTLQAFTNSAGEIQYRNVCMPDTKTTGRMSWQDMLRR